jgi:hypothetical protein
MHDGQLYKWSSGRATMASVNAAIVPTADAANAPAADAAAAAVPAADLPVPSPVLCCASLHVRQIVPAAAPSTLVYLVDDLGDIYRTDLVALLERVPLGGSANADSNGDSDSAAAARCVQLVACSEGANMLALTAAGDVWAWGDNKNGECAQGAQSSAGGSASAEEAAAASAAAALAPVEHPTRITGWPSANDANANDRIVELAAGAAHVVARTQAGRVLQWGRMGAAGAGAPTTQPTPLAVPFAVCTQIAAAAGFCLAIGSNDSGSGSASAGGPLFGWGKGVAGGTDEVAAPTVVAAVHAALQRDDEAFVRVSVCAASGAAVALTNRGRVVAWSPSSPPAVVALDAAVAAAASASASSQSHAASVARVFASATHHFVTLE